MTREELRDYVKEQRNLGVIPYYVYSTLVDGIDTLEQESFDGLTNGEVMQTMFPEVKVEIDGFLVRCVFIEHEFTTTADWWNAPYKAEKGD